jgi:hypothetical protein
MSSFALPTLPDLIDSMKSLCYCFGPMFSEEMSIT